MKISIKEFLILINLILAILLCEANVMQPFGCAIYALLTSVFVIWDTFRMDHSRITYSTALLLYTIATQFGLAIPYLLFGRETFRQYTNWTLSFMNSAYLPKAMMMGVIAVSSMRLGILAARRRNKLLENEEDLLQEDNDFGNRMYFTALLLLSAVLTFFVYYIVIGGMRLASTYTAFRHSAVYNSSLYHYILILFYVGTLYLASAGSIKVHKVGWFIWLITVLVFALNGNKGEFMYALLAVIGMKGIEGQRMNRKLTALIAGVVFLIIPAITSLRDIGIVENLSSFRINVLDAFGEIGMQLRMTIYCLRDISIGRYGYLWGESYWRPVFNILTPVFVKHTQATTVIRSLYPGNGYSQVIESYMNFHIPGVIAYFSLIGYFIGKYEASIMNRAALAYLGTIVCILINCTRNYFAFVPGHILMVTVIYLVAVRLKAINIRFKQRDKVN